MERVHPEDVNDESHDFLFKVVLVGDMHVGKTCIVQRFKCDTFIEHHSGTIGVDFTMKTMKVGGKMIKIQIWDTAGQERFRTITQSYYRSAHGVIIAYDITKMESFLHVTQWLDDVRKYSSPNVAVLLVGNKSDLDDRRRVKLDEALKLAAHHGVLDVLETSAKNATNVTKAFQKLALELKNRATGDEGSDLEIDGSIKLKESETVSNGSCYC
eukprot:m.5203 g.5203  ORF g.5203 m.5203 type:complete len:213 (+) comp12487_c0_seq2:561-1199(+)